MREVIKKIPYAANPKILVFQGEIGDKGKGQLILIDTRSARIDARWTARSGLGGKEVQRAYGPLPSNLLAGFDHYKMPLSPLAMPGKKGIDGNFYRLFPFLFHFSGTQRGDFGVHADRGANGTFGCIGLLESDWAHFEKIIADLRTTGLKSIPLLVANY